MNISTLTPLVIGGPYDESNTDNPCSVDSISNPDNVFKVKALTPMTLAVPGSIVSPASLRGTPV
jgi:hypothetical protein